MTTRARAAWILAVSAAAGLAGQTLLTLEAQCRRFERSLREDFRVVLFLRAPAGDAKLKVLEERLRAMPEAAEVRFVSAAEALEALKREDPELAESVALVGENPLPAAFELTPSPESFARLTEWLEPLREAAPWTDIRYKPGQVQAALRLRFYSHLLRAALSTLLCLSAALALAVLASSRGPAALRWPAVGWSLLGGALGAAAASAAFWPLRRDDALWALPSLGAELALAAACAALGAGLSLWRDES